MEPFEGTYVITAHTVVTAKDGSQEDDYTVVYGADVLKVKYASSQTSSAKPGDFPGTGLHPHYSYSHPDLTQVPQVSVPIRTCLMDKDRDKDGDLIIAKQPTPEPCMARVGDTLQYEPEPNGPVIFTHVAFDIISERAR